jgi:hypothetical protein
MNLIDEFYDGTRFFGAWSSPQKFGYQYRVRSTKEVIRLLGEYNGILNCGISVCTLKDDVPYLLYLPFDFDSDSLDKSWEDAMKFYNHVVDEGWDITINYSGYRGFHCLISVVPKPYSRKRIHDVQVYYKNLLNLHTCDSNIFGDIRRLIRIPGTLHIGKFKRVKGKGWIRTGEGNYCKTMAESDGDLMDLDGLESIPESQYDSDYLENGSPKESPMHSYPCLEKAMDNPEPGQLIRYSYVAYLLKSGKSPEEILKELEDKHSEGKAFEWNDWDLDYTANQINHISGHGRYNPLGCNSIKKMGLCIPDCIMNGCGWTLKSVKEYKNDKDRKNRLGEDV